MDDGLRARKKQRTRQALSDAATALFAERGFEAVTIAEIAARADVGVGTVFNYFRSKEELFFDRADAIERDLVETVATRPPAESAAGAFRRWHERELDFLLDPRGAAPVGRYFAAIAASPGLQAAELALFRRLEAALAAAAGPPGDPVAPVLAGLLMALHRTVVDTARSGDPDRTRRTSAEAFDLLAAHALTWGA